MFRSSGTPRAFILDEERTNDIFIMAQMGIGIQFRKMSIDFTIEFNERL